MKHKLLITSAAAALIAGTVLAAAQGMQQREGPGSGGMDRGGQGQMQQQPGQGKGEQGKGQQPSQREQGKGTTGQGQREQGQQGQREQGKGSAGQGQREQGQPNQREQGKGTTGQGQREQQGQPNQREQGKGTTGQGQREQGQREQGQRPGQREGGDGARDGARQGGGNVNFTAEQRTRIRQTVVQGGNAPRATNVNFSIRIGTAVPRTVRVVEVPTVFVEVHPEWRGFLYFIVDDEIIIVDRDYRIVAVFAV